ncbi:organic cation transporter protein-like isoform X2 [Glandiceps talaboti]
MEFDNILHSIGGFGKFQKIQVFFMFLALIPFSWFSFCNTFYSVSTAHYCRVYDNQVFEKNSTLKTCTIPYGTDDDVQEWDSCARYDVNVSETTIFNGSFGDCSYGKRTIDCDNGWVYDRSTFTNTQIMEFDLVCEDDWLKQLSKTTTGIGIVVGAIPIGLLSDVYGRKIILYLSLMSGTVLNLVIAFLPNFYSVLIVQCLMSALTAGINSMSCVLVAEIVSPKYRPMAVTIVKIGWSIGGAIVGVISIGCHGDWRKIQLVIALTSLIYIPYYWIIKESARWLIQKERTEEAGKVIREIARWNNKTYECEIIMSQNSTNGKKVENTSKEEMANASTERKYSLSRFSIGIMYGGISFNSNYFCGEIYTLYMLSCLVEIPGILLGLWLLSYLPRRWLLCTTMILTGVLWFSTAFIGNVIIKIVIITVAKMSETVAHLTSATVRMEIYPTTLRNAGAAITSEGCDIGVMVVPYIVYLIDIYYFSTYIIMAVLCVLSGLFILLLPETSNINLPETLQNIKASKLRRSERNNERRLLLNDTISTPMT